MTITLAQHNTYRGIIDRRIAEARRLKEERARRLRLHPLDVELTAEDAEELDRIAEVPRDEYYETAAANARRAVELRGTEHTLFGRIVAYCRANARPDGSVDRAALYAALAVGTTTTAHVRVAASKLRKAGRLPWRIDPLRPGQAPPPVPLAVRIREAARRLASPEGVVSRADLYAALAPLAVEERAVVSRRIAAMRCRRQFPWTLDDTGALKCGRKGTGCDELRAWCAEHARDGVVSRAELYAAFGATTSRQRQRLSSRVGTMALRGSFPWRLAALRPDERLRPAAE